jgi:hypothetical protein
MKTKKAPKTRERPNRPINWEDDSVVTLDATYHDASRRGTRDAEFVAILAAHGGKLTAVSNPNNDCRHLWGVVHSEAAAKKACKELQAAKFESWGYSLLPISPVKLWPA